GAFPGAIPPLIGWAAARGSLSLGAWILFGILFFWQFPHFLAIAWMYREDYARAGIKMLPVVEPSGDRTYRQILVTAAILVPISLLPSVIGITGIGYFFGATVLGMALLQVCLWAERSRTNIRAKWLMHATVIHIPILLGLMILDRAFR
ncbi:MAG: protoheme IX farnesyltransferase, partial [Candidatus Acidiferrales bacterium]